MSEQREEAAEIEQRYVGEHAETEEMLEDLDPAKPREQQSVDRVKAAGDGDGQDHDTDDHVEKMARDDP